ncbi:XRE family transcriptional regulator [Streptomyces sp. NPDC048389]|uniref:XRE family transcriptional regulator n=1 Tax=Streptomyces sp. NPDC048389 TaxID=3154622 RepID=UPI00345444D1
MTNLVRKGEGKPLRAAMQRAGMSALALAAATKRVDVRGQGIGPTTAYKLAGAGEKGVDICRLRTAWLVATVLREPLQELFDMPAVSTDTVERSTPHGDPDPR